MPPKKLRKYDDDTTFLFVLNLFILMTYFFSLE